jgi:predicted HicB family RNase H-like nuclease
MTHKNTGNAHARKDPTERANDHLHIRVRSKDKARWEKLARSEGIPLSQWIIWHLNEGVKSR